MEDTTTQHLVKYEQLEGPKYDGRTTEVKRKNKGLILTLVALLILALIGSSLGTWLWLTHQAASTNTASLANQVAGHAFFASSAQINEENSQGINNELQIKLQNIPNPAPGKSYYAWLLGDLNQTSTPPLSLGILSLIHGAVHFLYPGDRQHDNLIANYSRLLITEENINSVPKAPSSDHSTWRYYAELPQKPTLKGNHFRALDHLRNLLYQGSFLSLLGIHGGLNILLLRQTQKVWESVSNARDSWGSQAAAFIHSQVVRTLDYLDGTPLIQKDVPAGTPLLVDKVLAQVPLVTPQKNTGVAGYVDRNDGELDRLIQSPAITAEMNAIALKNYVALYKYVQTWLLNVRLDAIQLVKMSDAQLLQPSTQIILDDMVTQANYAFVGRLDPTSNEVQPGVVQIYNDTQRLATFNVMPYTSQK